MVTMLALDQLSTFQFLRLQKSMTGSEGGTIKSKVTSAVGMLRIVLFVLISSFKLHQ